MLHDSEFVRSAELLRCPAVESQHIDIASADNEQRRSRDTRQPAGGHIRPAATRDNGLHDAGRFGRCHERGGGSGTRTEEADRQPAHFIEFAHPVDGVQQALPEVLDVEDKSSVAVVIACEEIEEQRGQRRCAQGPRDTLIARTEPAAATAVGEDHEAVRPRWHIEQSREPDPGACDGGDRYLDLEGPRSAATCQHASHVLIGHRREVREPLADGPEVGRGLQAHDLVGHAPQSTHRLGGADRYGYRDGSRAQRPRGGDGSCRCGSGG